MRNTKYHEWLVPYLEGGLEEAQLAEIEARLSTDPGLAQEAQRLRRIVGDLSASAKRTSAPANAVVPATLWPRLRSRLEPVPSPRFVTRRVWWMAGIGAAAALTLATVWLPLRHAPGKRDSVAPPPLLVAQMPRAEEMKSGTSKPQMAAKSPVVAVANGKLAAVLPASPTLAPPTALTVPTAPALPPSARVTTTPRPVVLQKSGAAPQPQQMASRSPAPQSALLKDHAVPVVMKPPTRIASNLNYFQEGRQADSRTFAAPLPATVSPPPPLPADMPTHVSLPLVAPVEPPPSPTAPLPASATGGDSHYRIQQNQPQGSAGALAADAVKPQDRSLDSQQNAAQTKGLAAAQPPPTERPALAMSGVSPQAANKAAQADLRDESGNRMSNADGVSWLEAGQSALATAAQPPLWGQDKGRQQAVRALTVLRAVGDLTALQTRLEQKRGQAPQDLVTARILAAVYAFEGQKQPALLEYRRIVGLEGAVGEDWFALAQAEERAGNAQAARTAYTRALEPPVSLSASHAAIARKRS